MRSDKSDSSYNLATQSVTEARNVPCIGTGAKNAEILAHNIRALAVRDSERFQDKILNVANIVLALNDIVGSIMVDTVDLLKKDKKLWRHNLKRNVNMAYGVYRRQDNAVNSICVDMDIYMDFVDAFADNVQKDINLLRLSILQVLTKNEVSHRKTAAYVITVYFCIGLSCEVYRLLSSWIKSLYCSELKDEYKQRNLAPVHKIWRKVMYYFISEEMERKITEDANFKLSANILWQKVADVGVVDNAIDETMRKNKDKFTNEQWQENIEMTLNNQNN